MDTGYVIEAAVIYLAVAAGSVPCCVRVRYRQLRASHPHTHPCDVRYDLTHAMTGGVWRAVAWGPRFSWWLAHRLVVWLAVHVIGRRRVAGHVRDARIEAWENGLAALDDPLDLLTSTHELRAALEGYALREDSPDAKVERIRRRVSEREERLTRMLSA